jgi:hypothetical protein
MAGILVKSSRKRRQIIENQCKAGSQREAGRSKNNKEVRKRRSIAANHKEVVSKQQSQSKAGRSKNNRTVMHIRQAGILDKQSKSEEWNQSGEAKAKQGSRRIAGK